MNLNRVLIVLLLIVAPIATLGATGSWTQAGLTFGNIVCAMALAISETIDMVKKATGGTGT